MKHGENCHVETRGLGAGRSQDSNSHCGHRADGCGAETRGTGRPASAGSGHLGERGRSNGTQRYDAALLGAIVNRHSLWPCRQNDATDQGEVEDSPTRVGYRSSTRVVERTGHDGHHAAAHHDHLGNHQTEEATTFA